MPEFTLYGAVRSPQLDDSAVDAVSAAFHPADEDLCIWRDPADVALLRISTGVMTDDLDDALRRGREALDELLGLLPVPAVAEEVVAMDDERQMVWRARP